MMNLQYLQQKIAGTSTVKLQELQQQISRNFNNKFPGTSTTNFQELQQ
jgi:hypothetical protein